MIMSELSLDLQNIADIIEADVLNIQRTLDGTIESLVKQIEPDEKNADGSFVLFFDEQEDQVFWNPSNEDTDASELRNIQVRFLEPNEEHRREPVMILEFGFVGDDDFNVSMDSLRIETKSDLINVLLHRLNKQRNAKRTKKKK